MTLAEAHRLAQRRIGLVTVAQMVAAWQLLDSEDLDATFEQWLTLVAAIVTAQRTASARLAGAYLDTLRTQAIGDASFRPLLADLPNPKALATSMLVCGPVSIRAALGRGVDLAQAADVAQARTAAAGMRYALDGGRETVLATTRSDPHARGWQRIASGKACQFCSMLADRGAVYGEASADFQAHDGCSCSAEPVYA